MIRAAILGQLKTKFTGELHIPYVAHCTLTSFKNGRHWWYIDVEKWLNNKRYTFDDGINIYLRRDKDDLKQFGNFFPFKLEHLNQHTKFTEEELYCT